jgi:thiamine pyrophosphokinase
MSEKTRLQYDGPVILVGGGDVDWERLEPAVDQGHPVVAVDSGADALRGAGIDPDAIVGDMDSISSTRGWPDHAEVIEIAEQDSTDFEKALYTTSAALYLAFGVMGRRLDHSLTALHTLIKYRSRKSIVLIDCVDLVFIPNVPLTIDLPPSSRFSISPVVPTRFLGSTGLEFPLDGLTLETGVVTGTSNTVVDSRVSVMPEDAERAGYMVVLSNTNLSRVVDWYLDE